MTDKETLGEDQGELGNGVSHRQFIADYWTELAAIGLQGYRREGRGAVTISTDSVALGESKAVYVSDASLSQSERDTGSRWPSDKIEHHVQTYDPEAQIIVVVMREDGAASCYRVMGITQPHDLSRMKLN